MRALLLLVIAALGLGPAAASAKPRPFDRYVEGKRPTPTPGQRSGGLLLMGGGDRNHDAMRWFFAKAGNGHIVILRASYAGEIGKEFVKEIGGVASAVAFVFHDRAAASDPRILAALARADGIFLAGGDQANYVRYWKGTEVARLLTAHVAAVRALLDQGGAIGRKLDFLCQEFNREANTLCSKADDLALTNLGIELKAAIEQLREQAQNNE